MSHLLKGVPSMEQLEANISEREAARKVLQARTVHLQPPPIDTTPMFAQAAFLGLILALTIWGTLLLLP